MPKTVLQELNERFPFTADLTGQRLADVIAAQWDAMDRIDQLEMFSRMAMYVAVHDTQP